MRAKKARNRLAKELRKTGGFSWEQSHKLAKAVRQPYDYLCNNDMVNDFSVTDKCDFATFVVDTPSTLNEYAQCYSSALGHYEVKK